MLVAVALSEQVLKVVREVHENLGHARLQVLEQTLKRRYTSTHKGQKRKHDPQGFRQKSHEQLVRL